MNNINRFLCCASVAALVIFSSTRVLADDAKNAAPSLSRTAYSRIAPYVSPTTFLVARVDFEAMDLDAFGKTLDDLFVGALQEQGLDRYAVNASNREFRKTLEIIKEDFKPIVAALEALGLREAFLIAQTPDEISNARLIVPVASSKRDTLKAALNMSLNSPNAEIFDLKGAICVVNDRKADKKTYEKFRPNQHEKLKRLFETTPGATIQIFCSNLRVKKMLDLGSQELKSKVEDLPPETIKGINEFDEYFRDMQIALNLSELTFNLEASFATADHAENVRLGLVSLADYFAEKASARLSETSDEKYNLKPLRRELIRGALREFACERQGAVLVFKADSKSKELLKNASLIPIWGAMLVPASAQVLNAFEKVKEANDVLLESDDKSKETTTKETQTSPATETNSTSDAVPQK